MVRTYYDKVIELARPYLGPATEAFIARQCKAHLKTDPALLAHAQLQQLATWVEISGALVMPPAKAKELASRVASVGLFEVK